MRRIVRPSLRWSIVLAVLLSIAALPAAALADSAGTSPANASAIQSPANGSLGAGQSRWYQFGGDGASPAGVALDYTSPTDPNDVAILFNVDWTTPQGQNNADWSGFYRMGQGTQSGLPAGQRYWFTGTTSPTTYYVEVVNGSATPIDYVLALTGSAFPPPVFAPATTSSPPAAGVPPAPSAPPAASPPPAAPITAPANTVTDRSGLVLDPVITVEGEFSTVNFHLDDTSPNTVIVSRVMMRPPPNAIVDAVNPPETREEDGIVWYVQQGMSVGNMLSGYSVRFYGSADGAVVEVDWSSKTDHGALVLTVSGSPTPAPFGG